MGGTKQISMTLNDDSIMTFGKHKGKPLKEVPGSWLLWFERTATPRSIYQIGLMAYIKDNLGGLEEEDDMWEEEWGRGY